MATFFSIGIFAAASQKLRKIPTWAHRGAPAAPEGPEVAPVKSGTYGREPDPRSHGQGRLSVLNVQESQPAPLVESPPPEGVHHALLRGPSHDPHCSRR